MTNTQVRLSAEELGILPKELEALLWVRECLATDTMPDWMRFDMKSWGVLDDGQPLGCGTQCCIGGSMEIYLAGLTKLEPTHIVTYDERLKVMSALESLHAEAGTGHVADSLAYSPAFESLFFSYDQREVSSKTREGAVQAIDNFLAGETRHPWGKRLADD